MESLHEVLADVRSAWNGEIEARSASYDRGEMQTFAAEDVFAEATRACP